MFLFRNASGMLGLVLYILAFYSIYDVVKKNSPGRVWWIIALFFMPMTSIVYLIIRPKPVIGQNSPTQFQQQNPQNLNTADPNFAYTPQPYSPEPEHSDKSKVFRTVGKVLGIIAIVSGLLIAGFIILIVVSFSSYGSNK